MFARDSGLVEKIDDRARQASELCERYNNWANTDHAKIGLMESYLSGKAQYGIKPSFGDDSKYGFIIGAAHIASGRGDKSTGMSHVGRDSIDLTETFMLSDNVEAMEPVKNFVPSFIRFQLFDDATFSGGKPLYEFIPLISISRERFCVGGYREIGLANARYAESRSESACQNIKAASEDVDVSASFYLERERQRLFFGRYYDVIRRIGWKLFNTHTNVVIEPDTEALLEGWEFGFGPVNCGLSRQ